MLLEKHEGRRKDSPAHHFRESRQDSVVREIGGDGKYTYDGQQLYNNGKQMIIDRKARSTAKVRQGKEGEVAVLWRKCGKATNGVDEDKHQKLAGNKPDKMTGRDHLDNELERDRERGREERPDDLPMAIDDSRASRGTGRKLTGSSRRGAAM